jgi:hypothetical protein
MYVTPLDLLMTLGNIYTKGLHTCIAETNLHIAEICEFRMRKKKFSDAKGIAKGSLYVCHSSAKSSIFL